MRGIASLKEIAKNPKRIISYMIVLGFFNGLSDEKFLKLRWWVTFGTHLDLNNPRTFNEKLQWLKLNDRKDVYSTMVDKVAVKKYVSSIIGDKYIIPTLGVWDDPASIDFNLLPNKFVLKCNHNSGLGMCICKDKSVLNEEKIRKDLRKGLKKNYYIWSREWPYKNVHPQILAETYLVDESGIELKDYKVLCFNGEPKLIELHSGRFTEHQTQDFYDTHWNKTSISQACINSFQTSSTAAPKPVTLEEMLELSRTLSKGMRHVRVDWYSIGDKLYFGEITFFDGSGFDAFDDPKDDLLLGSWITL